MRGWAPALWAFLLLLVLALTLAALVSAREKSRGRSNRQAAVAAASHSGPATGAVYKPREQRAQDAAARTGVGSAADHPGTSSVLFSATLLEAGRAAGQRTLLAKAGQAEISPDDAAEHSAWLESGGTGAGAPDLQALANLRRWHQAPVSVSSAAPKDALVGPVALRISDAYSVLAWSAEEARTWYGATGLLPAGGEQAPHLRVAPSPWTGVDLRLVNDTAGITTWVLRLERSVSEETTAAETASRLLSLTGIIAPELAHALLDGDPLLVAAEPTATAPFRLAPLPPDPAIRLLLASPAGATTAPMQIPLEPGKIRPVELDLSGIFPADALRTLRLSGRVLAGDSALPVAGAEIEHLSDSPIAQQTVTAADGTFEFPALPLFQILRFAVTTSTAEGVRPVVQERTEFEITPASENPLELEVTWRIPAYRWVIMDLSQGSSEQLKSARYPRYPVYLLQQRPENSSSWTDASARHFIEDQSGVAVSVTGEGEYRVIAAAAPALIYESEPVRISGTIPQARERLNLPGHTPAPRQLRVIRRGTGEPVQGASVVLGGKHRSLPPLQGTTNAAGTWQLPPANREAVVMVSAPGGGDSVEQVVPPDAAEVVVEVD